MAQQSSWKKYLITAIKIAMSIAILGYLYRLASQEEQLAELALNPKKWHWLAASFGMCLFAHLISYVRWGILVRALGIEFSTVDATRIGLIGLCFGLVSIGVVGGDSIRIFYAARQARNRLADAFCSVFLDRALGMLTMFTFATVGFVWIGVHSESAEPEKIGHVQLVCKVISVATLIGWVVMGAFFLTPNIANSKLIKKLKGIPKVGAILGQLSDSALLYKEKTGAVLISIAMSALVNFGFVGSVFLLAVGLNVEHPPLTKHLMIAPISMAANAIPLPGGIGGMEPMLSYFYAAFSSSSEYGPGVLVAFGFRFMLLVMAALGAVAWFLSREQIRGLVPDQDSPADES